MKIIDLLCELTRQHTAFRMFYYGSEPVKGAGNELYPLVWADDPVLGKSGGNVIKYTVNFDALDIPASTGEVASVQEAMLTAGLEIIERMKRSGKVSVNGFSFVTLRDYYDPKAAGVRFTVEIVHANPVDICNGNFDADKQFPEIGAPASYAGGDQGVSFWNEKTDV